MQPLVTVITPAYNVEPFVGETIESVLAQTMPDFEMIVVDDGSRDRTAEVVRGFSDVRVSLIQTPNQGVSSARNAAMARARGRYFALLDADDIWDKTFLAEQLTVFEKQPEFSVVTGNARNLGGALDGELVRARPLVQRELTLQDMVEQEDSVFIMSVFRRSVFDTIGGFDPNRTHSEDYHFWLRAAGSGFRFVANPKALGLYRRRDGSASSDEIRMLTGIVDVLETMQPICADPPTSVAIARQLDRFRHRLAVCRATAHLLSGDYPTAARLFDTLHRHHDPKMTVSLAALLARRCPELLAAAYRWRLSWLEWRRDTRRVAVRTRRSQPPASRSV